MDNKPANDYVLLRADDISLLMPRTQIEQIEHIEDRAFASANIAKTTSQLQSTLDSNEAIFVSLSGQLTMLDTLANNRFIQTTFSIAPHIHFCWNEVRLFNDVKLSENLIPPSIRTPQMPVDAVVDLGKEQHAFTCQDDKFLAFILRGSENE